MIAHLITGKRNVLFYFAARQSRGRNRGSYNYNRYKGPGMSEQRLLAELLDGYDNDARGVIHPNKTINVIIELLLLRIQSLVSTCMSTCICVCVGGGVFACVG